MIGAIRIYNKLEKDLRSPSISKNSSTRMGYTILSSFQHYLLIE